MVTVVEYNSIKRIQRIAKSSGFSVDCDNFNFYLCADKGISGVIFKEAGKDSVNFDTLEELRGFLRGWSSAMDLLSKLCDLQDQEIKDRIEQQRVMIALKKPYKAKKRIIN